MGAENHTGMAAEMKAKRIGAGLNLRGLRFAVGRDSKRRRKLTELLPWNVLQVCESRLQVSQPVRTKLSHPYPHFGCCLPKTTMRVQKVRACFMSLLRVLYGVLFLNYTWAEWRKEKDWKGIG